MAVLVLLIPPFVYFGIPAWLWRNFLNNKFVKSIVYIFTKPLIALILFNGFFSFYHIPVDF